jgi:hypothetical protein
VVFFFTRNILIKVGQFQEIPNACLSIKENHNKIENVPNGYDLNGEKLQIFKHVSKVQCGSHISSINYG